MPETSKMFLLKISQYYWLLAKKNGALLSGQPTYFSTRLVNRLQSSKIILKFITAYSLQNSDKNSIFRFAGKSVKLLRQGILECLVNDRLNAVFSAAIYVNRVSYFGVLSNSS
jgi:hypothetical protein